MRGPGPDSAAARRTRRAWALAIALAVGLAGCGPSERDRVLVVVNAASPVSQAIGRYYAERRELPEDRVFAVDVPLRDPGLGDRADETVSRERFVEAVRDPIARELAARPWGDDIRILVIAKGVPLRVEGSRPPMETWLRDATGASVDAELSLLGSGRDGVAGVASMTNPFFESPVDFERFRRTHPESPLRLMVARLTGYQSELDPETGVPVDVRTLVDQALAPIPDGPRAAPIWLIDESAGEDPGRGEGNRFLLAPAAAALGALGVRMRHDSTGLFVAGVDPILGYASWGSNDPADPGGSTYGEIDGTVVPGRFAPRSVAVDFVSTNARTFTAPPHYGQSLVADLVRLGAAGIAGHVDEPTLPGVPRPHVLFWHYAQGLSAIEAYYRSLPWLGWQNVWIGDPLMRLPESLRATAGGDRDGDGVPDAEDNCVAIPNPDQRDTNGDGFGNACDADVDGDGLVTSSWGATLPVSRRGDVEWIALAAREGSDDPDFDLDGDGHVDARDVSIAVLWLFLPPGPSGRAVR